MSLVSVPCPACGTSTYLSLPDGHRFVATEPVGDDDDRDDLIEETVTCDDCGTEFSAGHAPARE